jgi:hypothetical protein
MKTIPVASVAALVFYLVVSGCDSAPDADSIDLTLSEEPVVDAALVARIEEIKELNDAAALYQIVKKDTMFSDTGKAADVQLIEVLKPEVEAAKARELFFLEKQYPLLPGSGVGYLFDQREDRLKSE